MSIPSIYLCYTVILSALTVIVDESELSIVTWNNKLLLLIVPLNDPNIDPVATENSSVTVTVVPSCIIEYLPI
jgi:hypothetical protein